MVTVMRPYRAGRRHRVSDSHCTPSPAVAQDCLRDERRHVDRRQVAEAGLIRVEVVVATADR